MSKKITNSKTNKNSAKHKSTKTKTKHKSIELSDSDKSNIENDIGVLDYAEQKSLMNAFRTSMDTKSKKKKSNQSYIGFQAETIPKSLRELLEIKTEQLPRPTVTTLLYKYIEKNNLYEIDKKIISPNKELKQIFGINKNDKITFFNLQCWLNKVYNNNV